MPKPCAEDKPSSHADRYDQHIGENGIVCGIDVKPCAEDKPSPVSQHDHHEFTSFVSVSGKGVEGDEMPYGEQTKGGWQEGANDLNGHACCRSRTINQEKANRIETIGIEPTMVECIHDGRNQCNSAAANSDIGL